MCCKGWGDAAWACIALSIISQQQPERPVHNTADNGDSRGDQALPIFGRAKRIKAEHGLAKRSAGVERHLHIVFRLG